VPDLGTVPLVRLSQRPYICVRDEKTQNTDGGTFTSGAWQTRVLNTIQTDTYNLIRLAANQILLPAGTYQCSIRCPAFQVSFHVARLQDLSRGVTLLLGGNGYTNSAAGYAVTDSWIVGQFTLYAEARVEVQHQAQVTKATDGFGIKHNLTTEVYTVAQFWKDA